MREVAARLPGGCERTFRRYVERCEDEGLDARMDKRMHRVSVHRATVDEGVRSDPRSCQDALSRYEIPYEIPTFPARSPTRSREDLLRSEGGSPLSHPCAGPIPCTPMEIDAAWKRLFALPAMVEHLLRAVAPELARRLDFTAMEQLAANWTRPAGGADPRTGAQRYADAVWRIRYAGADAAHTLVLLLEFQSTVDPDMAARTLAYTGLLREHLRRQDRLDPDGGLRTLAVVVYSGSKPWSAAGAAGAVPVSPDGTPRLTVVAPYRLLDSRRAAADDSTERNPALAVLGVEGAASPAQAAARMQAMAVWLPQVLADRGVRREFGASVAAWLAATMPRLFPSAGDEEVGSIGLGLFEEEDEMTTLHLRAKEWEAEWLRQGMAQGMERGLAQGMERGLAQGMERGLAQERSLLREQAARKFGAAVGEALARRLESASDAEELREIGVLIIDCADGAELLARVPPRGDA